MWGNKRKFHIVYALRPQWLNRSYNIKYRVGIQYIVKTESIYNM